MLVYSAMLARLAELASQFDVVHSHLNWVHIPLLHQLKVPFITTLHGRIDLPELVYCFEEVLRRSAICLDFGCAARSVAKRSLGGNSLSRDT